MYGVLVFEWVQTGLLSSSAFQIFVYHYGDVEIVTKIYNGWFTLPIMSAMISMVVQAFFAWRIYLLSRLRVLVGGIVTVSAASCVIGCLTIGNQLSLVQGACGIASGVIVGRLCMTRHILT